MSNTSAAHQLLESATKETIFAKLGVAYRERADWRNRSLVLCGFSPYAIKLTDTIMTLGVPAERLLIVDTDDDSPEAYHSVRICNVQALEGYDAEALFIICTNSYAGYYADLLRELGMHRVITYHLLSVCDERFDYPLERYSSRIAVGRMLCLLQNKEFFLNFLNDLADEDSKEIMSKWILYHLTLDAEYCGAKAISPPYFGQTIIPPEAYRVFADLGGYNGDTLHDFLSCNIPFEEYWYFEPDADLYREALKISDDPRIKYNNLAMGDSIGTALYTKTPDMSAIGELSEDGGIEVSVDTIDNVSFSHILFGFTAIKMDVGGGEANALRGAEQTIRTYHPALIVSAEHKPDDIKTLSELILRFCGDYKFYLRCRMDSLFTDLTIYAVAGER